MDDKAHSKSFGVFKPVGYLVVSFPKAEQADQGMDALVGQGVETAGIVRYTDREMLAQIDSDLAEAGVLASVGQEKNLVKAHRALAEQGYHWLVIPAEDRDAAARIADSLAACGAERAQLYGRFIIEEMIEHGDDEQQVAESPDRHLDAQTPSGDESERAQIRPADAEADQR
jgi:hypothetical protein